jgi:hypothetical protein
MGRADVGPIWFTWSEAANLWAAAAKADTTGWTPAAKGNLKRAVDKLADALPMMNDPNAMFLIVRGQTPVPATPPPREPNWKPAPPSLVPPYAVRKQLRERTLAVGRRRRTR